MAARFEALEDPYLRSRAEDLLNIGNKFYSQMRGQSSAVSQGQNLILTGDLISIADIARYKRAQLAGIICQSGSSLSHTAVQANALGLPAVMGTGKIKNLQSGISAILDGYQGQVILNPPPAVREEFEALASRPIFMTQIRAMLRASEGLNNLQLLLRVDEQSKYGDI